MIDISFENPTIWQIKHQIQTITTEGGTCVFSSLEKKNWTWRNPSIRWVRLKMNIKIEPSSILVVQYGQI